LNSITRRIIAAIHSPFAGATAIAVLAIAVAFIPALVPAKSMNSNKPTILLIHGAFAGSSSWNRVLTPLLAQGYPVVAVASPLRGVKSDAAYVANLVDSIPGPVILVGHSYGGNVITSAGTGKANVKALVYVAGVAPDVGESAATLAGKFPGSTLGPTLSPPVTLADGSKDLYIDQQKFHAQFAADLPESEARLMAATQRPITEAALNEGSTEPAWKTKPSWFVYGSLDRNIPPAVHAFMAERAKSRHTIEVKGASHVVMMSHPDVLVKLINEAAQSSGE